MFGLIVALLGFLAAVRTVLVASFLAATGVRWLAHGVAWLDERLATSLLPDS